MKIQAKPDLTITSLINLEELKTLLEAHYRVANIPVTLMDTNNNILIALGFQDICGKFFRENAFSAARCRESDNYIKDRLNENKPCEYKCKNGLWDAAIPVITNGVHIATLFFGQFFYEDENNEKEFFEKQAEELGFDKKKFMQAYDKVPTYSREKAQEIIGFYEKLVNYIADSAYKQILLKEENNARITAEKKLKEHQADLEKKIEQKTSELKAEIDLRRRAEEKSRERERLLKQAQKVAHIGHWHISFDSKKITWSDEIYSIMGIDTNIRQMTVEEFLNRVHPEDRERVRLAYLDSVKSHKAYDIEHRIMLDSGEIRYIHEQCQTEYDKTGNPLYSLGTSQDITEKKLIENGIRESEKRYRLLTESANDLIYTIDNEYRITFVNKSAEKTFGAPSEYILGKSIFELFSHETAEEYKRLMDSVYETGESHQSVTLNHWPNGDIWLEGQMIPLKNEKGDITGIMGVLRDITARKLYEKNLKENEQRLTTIARNLPNGIIHIMDKEMRYIYNEGPGLRKVGLNNEVLIGKTIFEILPFEQAKKMEEQYNKVLNGESVYFEGEFSGEHFGVNSSPLYDEDGNVESILSLAVNITEKKKAEIKLKESEYKYRSLFENITEGFAHCKMIYKKGMPDDFIYLDVNPAFEKLTGLKNVTGKKVSEIIPGIRESNRELFEIYGKVASTGKPDHFETYVEGLDIWFSISVYSPQKDHFVAVFDNITERKVMEEALKRNEAFLAQTQEISHVGGWEYDVKSGELIWTEETYRIHEIDDPDFIIDADAAITFYEDGFRDEVEKAYRKCLENGEPFNIEVKLVTFKNRRKWVRMSGRAEAFEGRTTRIFGFIADINDLKIAELNLEERIKESACLYRISEILNDPSNGIQDMLGKAVKEIPSGWYRPDQTKALIRYDLKEFGNEEYTGIIDEIISDIRINGVLKGFVKIGVKEAFSGNGENLFLEEEKKLLYEIASIISVNIEKRINEQKIAESESTLKSLLNAITESALLMNKHGKVLIANETVARRFGYESDNFVGNNIFEMMPAEISARRRIEVNKLLTEKRPITFEDVRFGRTILNSLYPIFDANNEVSRIAVFGFDLTEIKEAESAIKKAVEELEASNKELEQFAYVASHDLQEPLRTISSYTQLLERRYGSKLDEDAKDFINFAVDASNRMQRLINDLLAYSRVTTRGKELEKVESAAVLGNVLVNLQALITDNNAMIVNDDMPVVMGDESQLVRLFQNLIENSIKYRKEEAPRIHISTRRLEDLVEFRITDNGIGIEETYFERIFQIFQRLHTRRKYSGTGIGLAICKKIVERHGGTIRVESTPGEGSVFIFTLMAA